MTRPAAGVRTLWLPLTLGFAAVALAGVVTLAALSAASLGPDVARLVTRQERTLADGAAVAAGLARQGHGWDRAELSAVLAVVAREGGRAEVRDLAGRVVYSGPGFRHAGSGPEYRRPVTARGQVAGWVTVRFDDRGLGAVAGDLKAERWRGRLIAAAVAVAFAVAIGLLVSRYLTAPLGAMLAGMRARAAGDRSYRIRDIRGPAALRELLRGFNQAADALTEQDRRERDLVADIAHELRTPIAVLQAGCEAMLDGVSQATPGNIASLRDEVLRLGRMVEDLQRLSAAESAALRLRLEPHDLAGIAAESAASLDDSFAAAGVRLSPRLAPVSVRCDAMRMREVATNLLTNALKFTPAGGEVTIEAGPENAGRAVLRVSDTGVGIPAAELPHVTERFFRGRRSAGMAGGSGIGLTIVEELVRAHQGELVVDSEPGRGTTVTVRLPAGDGAAPGQDGRP